MQTVFCYAITDLIQKQLILLLTDYSTCFGRTTKSEIATPPSNKDLICKIRERKKTAKKFFFAFHLIYYKLGTTMCEDDEGTKQFWNPTAAFIFSKIRE